ncbi:MAG: acyl carrier protein [Lachnospiraceae bacterium]|jgi:acyl carrier protein|nr:acyl carrier protein [Lachnospiraceae bacterium]MCR4936690.1 acyl carrier protein [Lachnospiraceae bacterium]
MSEYDVLKRAVEKVLRVYSKEISVSVTFENELGADSIDIAQILKCVEDELDIDLKQTDIDSLLTVGDALAVIKKRVAEKKENGNE